MDQIQTDQMSMAYTLVCGSLFHLHSCNGYYPAAVGVHSPFLLSPASSIKLVYQHCPQSPMMMLTCHLEQEYQDRNHVL